MTHTWNRSFMGTWIGSGILASLRLRACSWLALMDTF